VRQVIAELAAQGPDALPSKVVATRANGFRCLRWWVESASEETYSGRGSMSGTHRIL
jgi:hypothetical protein